MKYLITLKDSNIHVEPSQKPTWWHGDTSINALPETASQFFEYGEYVTLEFDDLSNQMRVCHPKEGARDVAFPHGLSVYRKWINSSDWRESKTYQVSIYSDGHHTCTCPSWFYKADSKGGCKHIRAILSADPYNGTLWEIIDSDDREEFGKEQSRLYDPRSKDGDGETA